MNITKRTEPTRRLFDPNKETQLLWVAPVSTDIRATFAAIKAARLAATKPTLQAVAKRSRG